MLYKRTGALMEAVESLLKQIVEGFRVLLSEELAGLYLHGSLAMGGFNPHASDVDFLVVVRTPLEPSTKQAIVKLTLDLAQNAPPRGLEFSAVLLRFTQQFVHPTPFEVHYSRAWHEQFVTGSVDLRASQRDPDLAAHFVITRERGICLYGLPIAEAFGEVPESDYWASIAGDAEQIFEDITSNPIYSILNLCRVLAYKREKVILSKYEGGSWSLDKFNPRFRALIRQALEAYQSSDPGRFIWNAEEVIAFGNDVRTRLNG